jgi:hypothetical protein
MKALESSAHGLLRLLHFVHSEQCAMESLLAIDFRTNHALPMPLPGGTLRQADKISNGLSYSDSSSPDTIQLNLNTEQSLHSKEPKLV